MKISEQNVVLKLLSYPKSILATVFLPLWTALASFLCITIVSITRSHAFGDWVVLNWGRGLMWANKVNFVVRGQDNLPEEGVIFVFNHSSDYDIPAIHAAIPKHARFGAKIELFKVPILKQAMTVMGVLPIVRGDREKVFKLYEKSIKRVQQGQESFILAAEGTRQYTHGVGEKFKAGPFVFAINAKAPIVPVVIVGAHELLPKKRWFPSWGMWRPVIIVQILPPQPSTSYSLDTRKEFQEKVRTLMSVAYTEGRKEWLGLGGIDDHS